jgi:hypothetical protein
MLTIDEYIDFLRWKKYVYAQAQLAGLRARTTEYVAIAEARLARERERETAV